MNMIKSVKSISKRTLAIILAVMILLTSGIVGAVAANVELAETGAQYNLNWKGKVYFLAPESWDIDTYKYIQVDITRTTSASSSNYQFYAGTMTRMGTSRLFYLNLSADHSSWNQNEYIAFTANSSTYGSGTFNLNGNHYYTTPLDYGCNNSSNYYLFKPSSASANTASNGNAMTGSYGSSRTSVIRATQTVSITCDDVASSACGTVKMSGYQDTSDSAITSSSTTSSGSSVTYNAVQGSSMTLTATVNSGYNFVGWYSGTTLLSSSTTYSYNVFNAKTITAKFEKADCTATFVDYDGDELATSTVSPGETPTYTGETLTRTGYEFMGWSLTQDGEVLETLPAISDDTTFYAVWEPITYTISYYNEDGSTLGKGSADYGTKVNVFNNAPEATKESTTQYDYAFAGWLYEDGSAVGADDLVTGDIDLYASYTKTTRAYTVNISAVNGTVSVAYADGTVVTSGAQVPYGTELTLTATPDKFYNVGTWDADGVAFDTTTYTVTGDVTLTHTFAEKTTYTITFNPNDATLGSIGITGGTGDFESVEAGKTYKAEDGASVIFTIRANADGYYISKVGDTEYTNYDNNEVKYTVAVDGDKTIDVVYSAIPSYTITASASPAEGGSVSGDTKVYEGSKVTLTATPNEGYKFTGWTYTPAGSINESQVDLSQLVISFTTQNDVEFTANFAPVTGTINVTASEGGSVDNEGGTVTYPETVTSTATASVDGYLFTGWTVSSDGVENTDYKVTENSNVITVQILTDGTVVNVEAKFNNAQKLKVYTYSDQGFNSLKVTEGGTAIYDDAQTAITFGDETWYTPGELTLSAGYNEITAQLYSDDPLAGGTGNLIMFKDTLGWGSVYFYNKSTSMYLPDVHTDKSDQAVCTEGVTPIEMKRIGTSSYYYAYVTDDINYIAFTKDYQKDYFWLYNTKASYRGNDTGYTSSTPMFVPTSTVSYTSNGTTYYNGGSWSAKPTDIDTDTDAIDITSELYDENNQWKGLEEIWLYFKADGTTVVATQRRVLNDYVTSALIKNTYNNGVNDMEYTSTTWTAFTDAYKDAVAVLGAGASTDTEISSAYTTLETAYKALTKEENVTITGVHGAEPYSTADVNYGILSFSDNITVTEKTNSGNIGDNNGYHYQIDYLTGTVKRGTTITIYTDMTSTYATDYLCYGWVINGTDFVAATQDIDNSARYVGTYTCDMSATIIPVYFQKNTANNWETDENIVKIYANIAGSSEKWGNYISAYTWTGDKSYYQFGHWTGQVMIPDKSTPGMYYTYVEMAEPGDLTNKVSGIAFTNYGGNTPINSEQRYQTYDYYEFIELEDQDFNNIVFQLKTFEGNTNSPSTSGINLSDYQFDYFRDFSGNKIDIAREKLEGDELNADPALYVVRTGPIKYSDGAGAGWGTLDGSDFYVDAYVYDSTGKYLGRCKTYELTNLERLKTDSGLDLTSYVNAPVMVDYASLTSDGTNWRFDGEWYGTKYGLTNVTIEAQVAYLNNDGTVTYYGTNEVENVGNAYFNGEASQEVSHGSEGHTISATALGGTDFVGWFKANVADDGTISIDATATPLFAERSATVDASSDAVYVAVFKEHPEGTFTVNNYYYTYADFAGQTISPYAPPVFGGDTSYSIRDVQIKKIYDDQTGDVANATGERAGTYTQSMEAVSVGDKLKITIYTKPTYEKRDYVYAWYIQANDSYGVNFEEIGTNELQDNYEVGAEKSFTFTYEVEEGVNSLTIFSDVVHITPEVTLTYIYNNRYNVEQKYIVKHTLSDDEIQNNNYAPYTDTIEKNAPYVGDIYKNVEWVVDNVSSDATNWTLRATETDVYTVNITVNGTLKTVTGKFYDTISIYARDINESVGDSRRGLWYLEKSEPDNGTFDAGVDEILGYGTYYGYVITGDANVYFTDSYDYINQIILADAIYGYERATDENGNVTTNKVYVDYLISMMLDVYSGEYIDLNGNGKQDDNEPTVVDEYNSNVPVSLDAIEAAGYKVDYGMVLELINTFNEATKQDMLDTYYNSDYEMSNDEIQAMFAASKTSAMSSSKNTFYYSYSAKAFEDYASDKNRVIMTFGFDNTDANRSRFYNAKAYLLISDSNGENTMYLFSNQAKLNIAEADKVTNS